MDNLPPNFQLRQKPRTNRSTRPALQLSSLPCAVACRLIHKRKNNIRRDILSDRPRRRVAFVKNRGKPNSRGSCAIIRLTDRHVSGLPWPWSHLLRSVKSSGGDAEIRVLFVHGDQSLRMLNGASSRSPLKFPCTVGSAGTELIILINSWRARFYNLIRYETTGHLGVRIRNSCSFASLVAKDSALPDGRTWRVPQPSFFGSGGSWGSGLMRGRIRPSNVLTKGH
jgi:hypothetical protein